MALTPLSGSSTTPSSHNDVPSDIPSSQGRDLHDMPFITDSALNKYSIDTSQYPNATKSLIGFMKGKRILVTYFRLLGRGATNNRTNIADLTTARHVLDTEYQKIINLEITIPKELEFTANNAKANMSIKGEAMFYPNMNPNVGDMFTMGLGDGRIGVCRISSVTPMSWRNDRIYTTTFVVHEFVDDVNHEPIEGAVTQVSVFSKENYLGGTAALLSEQSYLQLAKIREFRSTLTKFYHLRFFNDSLCSYVRPDGIYDPCLVQFMSRKIENLVIRPKNLLGQIATTYGQSLWARLEDRYNTSLYMINPCYTLEKYRQTRMGVFVTELVNRTILLPAEASDDGEYYLYSKEFYTGIKAQMSEEELLVYKSITERVAGDLSTFIANYLDLFQTLSPLDQFYKIPIYIHLIDMSLQSQYREIDAPSMNFASEE